MGINKSFNLTTLLFAGGALPFFKDVHRSTEYILKKKKKKKKHVPSNLAVLIKGIVTLPLGT